MLAIGADCGIRPDSRPDRLSQLVEGWHFSILRFAITHSTQDRQSVIELAQHMDGLGRNGSGSQVTFFFRTSTAVCTAICNPEDPARRSILKRYVMSIEQPRLRRAAVAAFEFDPTEILGSARVQNSYLWKGLAR
jgi:hypothetical protein